MQSFPQPGSKQQVSLSGGTLPRWRPKSSELFYVTLDFRLMSVTMTYAGAARQIGKPVQIFQSLLFQNNRPYEVAADGRFLLNIGRDNASTPIQVILNWAAELAK